MTSTLKAVCLIAALLASLAASTAMASPLLTAEDMSTLRGGCAQLYCVWFWCGTDPKDCSYHAYLGDKICWPGECDEDYQKRKKVENCGSLVDNDRPCTRGAQRGCGQYGLCVCLPTLFPWGSCAQLPWGTSGVRFPCIES